MLSAEKKLITVIIVVAVLLIGLVISGFVFTPAESANPAAESLAKCLAEKKVTMYGAEWCSHCQNQKKMFGRYFSLIPHVECPENMLKCQAMGINGFPTWFFPSGASSSTSTIIASPDKKIEGELSLEKLAQESGCEYRQAL